MDNFSELFFASFFLALPEDSLLSFVTAFSLLEGERDACLDGGLGFDDFEDFTGEEEFDVGFFVTVFSLFIAASLVDCRLGGLNEVSKGEGREEEDVFLFVIACSLLISRVLFCFGVSNSFATSFCDLSCCICIHIWTKTVKVHSTVAGAYRIVENFRWCKFSHKLEISLRIKF